MHTTSSTLAGSLSSSGNDTHVHKKRYTSKNKQQTKTIFLQNFVLFVHTCKQSTAFLLRYKWRMQFCFRISWEMRVCPILYIDLHWIYTMSCTYNFDKCFITHIEVVVVVLRLLSTVHDWNYTWLIVRLRPSDRSDRRAVYFAADLTLRLRQLLMLCAYEQSAVSNFSGSYPSSSS